MKEVKGDSGTTEILLEPSSSLDAMLEDVGSSRLSGRGPSHVSITSHSVVGTVLEGDSPDGSKRFRVRWIAPDGSLGEQPLRAVRGLAVRPGDSVILTRPRNWHEWIVTGVIDQECASQVSEGATTERRGSKALDLTVDGKRVLVEGHDEVVLRCGEASITLRSNGRVVIRGTYVETRAEGTNRIKGGSVQIN